MVIIFVSCQSDKTKDEITKEPISELKSQQPLEAKVAPLDCKATDFTYDEETLEYQLVWSDEFDYEGVPDSDKWSYDTGGHGWAHYGRGGGAGP